jgi:hypothetical protein
MTGNVAQVFVDDEAWLTMLRNLRHTLRPGGHLAFESRNPAALAWEQWNREQTLTRTNTPSGPLEVTALALRGWGIRTEWMS